MKNIIKNSVKSCAINKISQLRLFKIYSKIQFVLKTTQLVWGRIDSTTSLVPNISFLSRTKWLHSTKMWRTVRIHWQCSHWGGGYFLKIYKWVRCVWLMRHDTKHLLPSCTACRRTANLPGLAWQNIFKKSLN